MDNQTDKSQDATPYKLDEARKKGQVSKSVEFVSIASLIVMLSLLLILLPRLATNLSTGLKVWLLNVNQLVKSDALVVHQMQSFLKNVGSTVFAMLLAGAISAILFNILHAGPVFSLYPMKMDFSKLNPVTGLKKIFSKKGLFEIVKLVLKFVFIGITMMFIWGQIKNLVLFQNSLSIANMAGNWKSALTTVVTSFLFIFLVFALIDLWFSKRDFANKMRMSTRDLKDEYKKREGDPEIKNKRKKGMQQLIKSIMSVSNIKNADVIITNPTHFAVALQYRAYKMPLPKVLSKGRGFIAKIIIHKAKQLSIPIVRQPALARKIHKDTQINSYISTSEQLAVAEVYRSIIKLPGSKVFT
jgi:flagellar biosynthesis protein FlhB